MSIIINGKNETKYIFYYFSVWSIVLDYILVFVTLAGLFYINYHWIGNNVWLDAIITILFFMALISMNVRGKQTYYDKQKLIDDLQKSKI